jgi:deoxyribonuclease-4
MNIGAHMSIAGGVHRALDRGLRLRCSAVQLFVKNRNQWCARSLAGDEIERFRARRILFAPGFIVAHASYLVNLASPEPALRRRSIGALSEELRRSQQLGIPYLVVHPGSHRGDGEERGLRRVARSIDAALAGAPGQIQLLLETTAGQGDTLGSTFEQLARIVDRSRRADRLGICLDTCHIFAAGYDLRTPRAYRETFERFDRVLGLNLLKVLHVNDSLRELGSRIDRHTHIGRGMLGLRAFSLIVNDRRFFDRPMILETPKGPDDRYDRRNLSILRKLRRQM